MRLIEKGKAIIIFVLLTVVIIGSSPAAAQLKLAFDEITQSADLIYIGTVERQSCRLNDKGMIVTDVYFNAIEIVSATERSLQKNLAEPHLTYAGGQIGDNGMRVSGTPTFQDGHRYLLCIWDDGKTYANPIVGEHQGFFEIIQDTVSQQKFVLTAGKHAIVGINAEGIRVHPQRVARIQNGHIIAEELREAVPDNVVMTAPVPSAATDSASVATRAAEQSAKAESPLTLSEFLKYIKEVSLKAPLLQRTLKREGAGLLYQQKNGKMHVESLGAHLTESSELAALTRLVPRGAVALPKMSSNAAQRTSKKGGAMGACGYHDLNLTMEQVPAAWWSWAINNDTMWMWNQFMDIYRYVDDDGSYGDNGENEFCGWVNDADLNSVYGFTWGSGIAMCITWDSCECCEISQSDVLWNPAYSWTDNESVALGNSGVILLRPVAMHELGHSWGEQRRAYVETYDYDQPTVMHSYYHNIVENGWGIHWPDAYLVRRQYDDQTGILGITDIGVESYYASNGLHNATTNKSSYYPGESITLSNVTVENMSYAAVSDLRVRVFLSTDRIITTGDRQMGSYWSWGSFSAEAYSVGTYTTNIPNDAPPGTYYVGAIVTVNGYNNDGFTANNAVSFYTPITVLSIAAPTGVSASDAGYTDRGYVTWNSVTGASHYRVYRNTTNSSSGATALGSWQTGLAYADLSAVSGQLYYYWVRAATNSAGANISAFSAADTGWRNLLLSNNTPLSDTDIPKQFSFMVNSYDWCGVALNPYSSDHDLIVVNNPTFSSPYATSNYSGNIRDFVVTNGHSWGDVTHYARVYYGSASSYTIEAEGEAEDLSLGTASSSSFTSTEVIHMYEASFTNGKTYTISVNLTSGSADVAIFVFRPSRTSGTRATYSWAANYTGAGGDENLSLTADESGYYGIVLLNDNAGSANYTFRVAEQESYLLWTK